MRPRQVTAAASRSGASLGAMPTVTLFPATAHALGPNGRMPGKKGARPPPVGGVAGTKKKCKGSLDGGTPAAAAARGQGVEAQAW